MFLNLIFKEIKQQFKSITFYLFIGVIILFYSSQFIGDVGTDANFKPIPPEEYREAYDNEPYYGYEIEENAEKQMERAYARLLGDAEGGSILQRGFLMNKVVNLSEEQKEFMRKAANKISNKGRNGENFIPSIKHEEFKEVLKKVDDKLGGGTYYSEKYNDQLFKKDKTYEKALEEFENMINYDNLSNAYGRLFGDYMGFTSGFFPIFLAAFVLTRDKRYRMSEIIYSREISSYKYVIAKYLGLFISVLLVYLALASHATILVSSMVKSKGYTVEYLAFYKYTFAWIAPTILFTISMGFLIPILVENGIVAIPIQFGIWVCSLLPLIGDYSLSKFVIRFNVVGGYNIFMDSYNTIIINRIFYTIVSFVLVLLSGYILSYRRGRHDGIFKKKFSRKSKKDSRTPSLQS